MTKEAASNVEFQKAVMLVAECTGRFPNRSVAVDLVPKAARDPEPPSHTESMTSLAENVRLLPNTP